MVANEYGDPPTGFIGKRSKTVGGIVVSIKGKARRTGRNMEPKSGRKPINVLAEYLTSWIRENSEEALPFDSFESLRPHRVAQKDVERWIFNCNYIYSRVGNFLYDENLLPDDAGKLDALILSIERSFKAISDNTPLDLRSKPQQSVVYELSRDWPPFNRRSRNSMGLFRRALERFATESPGFCDEHQEELGALEEQLAEEAAFYAEVGRQAGTGPRAFATRCRELLPIWCAKEINPIVTLLIWTDDQAIARLASLLREAFSVHVTDMAASEDAIDAWYEATLQAQATYIDTIDDDNDLSALSVREIGALLATCGFSLDHGGSSARLPRWLLGKSRLIWNIVICTVLGPGEAIGGIQPRRSATVETGRCAPLTLHPRNLNGEALLRRRYRSGRVETVDRLALDSVRAPGLWKVIGSHYDAHAPLPNSAYRGQFAHLGAVYVASEVSCAVGAAREGSGDSRFHVELTLELDQDANVSIVLHDLDSKNGTCVLRAGAGRATWFAFPGRRHLTEEDWAVRLGVPKGDIHLVRELPLERGDIIHLASSCFELI